MTPFLIQVARPYLDVEGLEDYCFVFPNRRSGQFFTDYLKKELVAADLKNRHCRPHLLPCVTTINDLVTRMTNMVAATDIELIFTLYEAYCQAMGEQAQEFDRFIYWAQLIISDFNDIDKSLADARAVYTNLDDLHSLSSNYLTADVKEKVERIFGESLFTAFFDTSVEASLWQERLDKAKERNSNEPDTNRDDVVKREFVSLWNALPHIYELYHKLLSDKGLASSGMQLKCVAENPPEQEPYSRLVFVGFGVLSAAEVRLFEHFDKMKLADFWWDNAGVPALLKKAPHDPGALLIRGYCKRFNAKPLAPLDNGGPELRVVSVPSAVGQAKVAFDEVARMTGGEMSPGIDTAIVLPDENLLVPLLHSVSDVTRLNITLGYPLRSSGIVSLMHIVANLHHQAGYEHQVWTYYREDVNNILSHPLIKTYFTDEALAKSVELARTNRFRVPASELTGLEFGDLFTPAMVSGQTGNGQEAQADYIDQLMAFCNKLMAKMKPADDEEDDGDEPQEAADGVTLPLQHAFLVMYMDVLGQIKESLAQCQRVISPATTFYLIDRLCSSAVVPFTGEPLQGMQVMGLLETRNLDFDNVVILSVNERVLPRRRGINSFIPNYMRRNFGMSTTEQQEAIMAFNFYRLLNRASHVTLVYDSGMRNGNANEPSRYIAQLEKIYGCRPEHVEKNVGIQTSSPIDITAPNPGRDAVTAMYLQHHDWADQWFLSASAINKFINCPLSFYLRYVQGLNDDNDVSDFMDYGTFGTIIHDVLKTCYQVKPEETTGHTFTADEIRFFMNKKLQPTVEHYIKKHYLHISEEKLKTDTRPLTGEALMLVETIMSYVGFVLEYDLRLIGENNESPFTVVECEKRHELPDMEIGGYTFNFTYMPDRVDRLADGTVRIVDYKTGKDPTSFSKIDDLFNPHKDDTGNPRCKAILQLFLYCYAYLLKHPEVSKVHPVIYKITSMDSSGVKMGKEQFEFTMDNEVVKQFTGIIGDVVRAIYEDGYGQAHEGSKHCNYCRFIDFCRRSVQESYY